MNEKLRSLVVRTRFYAAYAAWQQRVEMADWLKAGKPLPPPHRYKQRIVIDYARRFNLRSFVETGTYHGAMTWAVRNVSPAA